MKIYVVIASEGSYDSYHKWVYSVHTNPQEAEDSALALTEKNDKILLEPPPVPCDEYGEPFEDLALEQQDAYNKWWVRTAEAREFDSAKVFTFETGRAYEHNYPNSVGTEK